jgi:rhodanese-related sulfurtransferase
LAERLASPTPPVVLDVRSRSGYEPEDGQIPGSVRVLPDQVLEWAARDREINPLDGAPVADGRKRTREVVAYCT